MTRKHLGLALALALAAAAVVFVLPVLAGPSQPENPQPIYRGDTIDIGPVLRAKDLPIEWDSDMSTDDWAHSLDIVATEAYTVGDQVRFLALDNYRGVYFFTDYNVVTITEYAEVWVQTDLNYYNLDGTPNPIHPDAKDPLYVTEDRMNYMADFFNDVIYPTDTDFFGMPDSHDGTNSFLVALGLVPSGAYDGDGDKIIILISNVRDLNFYDPVASSSYIAGFYSSTFEFYSDRNMITIDSKQWNRRVGGGVDRPYLYEGTVAHEMQHLIHDDYSPNEDSWVNEGMSGLAEFLNGLWFTEDLGDRTQWQTWPENSVVLWGDQPGEILADYQLSNAFMAYTAGRISGNYTDTAKLTQETEDGILGFNAWLSDTAMSSLTFEDLFADFRIDMLYGGYTDDAQPTTDWNGNFLSDYQSPLETIVAGPPASRAYLGLLRDSLDSQGYNTDGVPTFGTDFIEVCWSNQVGSLVLPVTFDGDEAPPATAWEPITATEIFTPAGAVAGDVLYSGHSNLTDNFVVFGPVSVGASDALSFDHYYNIEDAWDYGFVQVTTDTTGMSGWVSLDIAGMMTATDPSAHPIITTNVPGFSGFSGGWITATYDFSGTVYAGEDILLAFRYSTDWATAGSVSGPAGWAIDNVMVGATSLTQGTLSGGRSIHEVRNSGTRFAFEFLTWGDGDTITVTNVYSVALDASQAGTFDLATLVDAGFDQAGERGVFMVSAMADVFDDLIAGGLQAGYADYSLTGLPPSLCTSDVDAYGVTHAGATRVYAGEVVTVAVHADNLGSSINLTTTEPAMFYVGMETPADTAYATGSATNGAVFTDDLSTVAGSFPAVEGVYWTGQVTDYVDFEAGFTSVATLLDSDRITATVHFASDATASPDQSFTEEDSVGVINPFSLSGLLPYNAPFMPGTTAHFRAAVLNLSQTPKSALLVADYPNDTTFAGVTGATVVATSTTQVTVTQVITPYATSGGVDVIFSWQLGSSYDFGDVITSTAKLIDVVTGESFDLSAMADVDAAYELYLPIVFRNF